MRLQYFCPFFFLHQNHDRFEIKVSKVVKMCKLDEVANRHLLFVPN